MRARVPASAANLGPGFDVLAVALALYLTVEIEPAKSFSLLATGFGADIPADDHLGVRVARSVLGHNHFALTVHSDIPLARGLGSSAALAAAAAAAAGAADPLLVAATADGHPENAAASVRGGLVAACMDGEQIIVTPCPLDESLRFVIVVPDDPIETERARGVLPAHVPLADATFNIGRLPWLLDGLAHHERLSVGAMDDRLHQPYRAGLLPFARHVLGGLRDAGALATCWCGSGSSLMAVTTEPTAASIASAGRELLESQGLAGEVLVLAADRAGLVVE